MTTVEEIFARNGVSLVHDVEGTDNMKPAPKTTSSSVDTTPWENYKQSDYTPEQWHAACLIHQHDGDPTSKDQCKLPVKTPSGKLNKGGVQAAAAALAGARGGVQASSDDKAKAAKALLGHYKTIGDDPPDSLKHDGILTFDELRKFMGLSHYGVKGMHWGIRTGGKKGPVSRDAQKTRTITKKAKKSGVSSLSNKELQQLHARLNLESKHKDLHPSTLERGHQHVKSALAVGGTASAVYAFATSPLAKAVAKSLARPPGGHYIKK